MLQNNLFQRFRSFLIIALLISVTLCLSAQDKVDENKILTTGIKGSISDAITGDTLVGVTIVIKGTQKGTVSNNRGIFNISLQPDDYTLVFSYTGYETMEMLISVKGNQFITIALHPKLTNIDEVKITSQRKFFGNMEYGRDIPTIGSKAIELQNVNNASDILHASVAGVWATNTSGSPGDHEKIRIRGQNSFFSSAEPLYVVDGVPVPIVNMSSLGIADLNIHDIENVTILKDASSTALYGYQGGNGVVLIDTKKGGENEINFSAKMGFQFFNNYYDLMQNNDFYSMLNLAKSNLKLNLIKFYPAFSDTLKNTNWQKEIFKTGYTKEYQLSGSTTIGKTRLYLSGNYNDQTGVIPTSSYTRYTLSANINRIFWKKLAVAVGYRGSKQQNKNNQDTYMGNPVIIRGINNSACMLSTPDSLFFDRGGFSPTALPRIFYRYPELGNYHQKVNEIIASDHHSLDLITQAINGSARFQLNDYLSLNAMESLMLRYSNYDTHSDLAIVSSNEQVILYNQQYNIAYFNTFGQHKIDITGAYRYYTDNLWWKVDTSQGQLNNYSYLRNSMAAYGPNGSVIRTLSSYVVNASYNYRETYFISAVINYSNIKEGVHINEYSPFPSVAASWDVAHEKLFRGVKWLNNFSLYVNWGKSGNYPLNGLANDLYQKGQYTYPTGTNTYQSILQLANHYLKQEETEEIDYGIKSAFLNKRFLINMTYYKKNITNLIMQQSIPLYYGGGKAFINVGQLYVSGMELGIEAYPIMNNDFIWHISFSISGSGQEIKKLVDNQPMDFPSNDLLVPEFRILEGQPIGDIYGYKNQGIWINKDNINNKHYVKYFGMKYLKIDTTSKQLNTKDIVVIGNSIPKYTWNLSNTFQYKDFSITMLWYAVQGLQKFNGTRASTYMSGANREVVNFVKDSINPMSTPIFYQSSYFVEDASFIRLKTLTFTYEPSKEYIKHIKLRFAMSFENLVTITKYKGYDPEATTYTDNNFSDNAIDRGAVPSPKTIFITIGLKF